MSAPGTVENRRDLRREREQDIRTTYDLLPLDSPAGIRRLLEIAALDTLQIANSVERNETLVLIARAATQLLAWETARR